MNDLSKPWVYVEFRTSCRRHIVSMKPRQILKSILDDPYRQQNNPCSCKKGRTPAREQNASAGNRTRGWPNQMESDDVQWQRPILPLNHQC